MKKPIGSQDKCITEMVSKGIGMCNKDLVSFNRPHKHQQATSLSDITTAKGDKIDKLLMLNWQETHKGSLGGNSPTTTFGAEHPTKEDWMLRRRELSKIHTPTFKLLSLMDRLIHPLACMWRYYYDRNKDKIQAKLEGGTEVYTRMDRQSRRYKHLHREAGTAITGHPATIIKLEDGALKVQEVGHDQVLEADE